MQHQEMKTQKKQISKEQREAEKRRHFDLKQQMRSTEVTDCDVLQLPVYRKIKYSKKTGLPLKFSDTHFGFVS